MVFRISRLALDSFRSWSHVVVDFEPGVTVLVGRNGIGKTNIIEAIEFLASGSSHRSSASKFLVQRGATKATVRANVTHDVTAKTLEVTIPVRGAVRSRVDSAQAGYFRDIAGMVTAVVFSPRDQQIVAGNPVQRRVFLDSFATMMFPDYYSLLQNFRQISKQRTAILKRIADSYPGGGQIPVETLTELEVWTSQFIDVGVQMTKRRATVVEKVAESFADIYSSLSEGSGKAVASVRYEPSFEEALMPDRGDGDRDSSPAPKELIAQHFQRIYPGEVARGANLIGPHRDDFSVMLDGDPAREFASNGELWTLGLALKMAQFSYLAQTDTPILILDDVFAQLDESRRRQILEFAQRQEQVIITVAAHSDIPPLADSTVVDVEKLAAAAESEEISLPADLLRRSQNDV